MTVTYERLRLPANGGPQGIAWAQLRSAPDVVGVGGWAEQPSLNDNAATGADPDPATIEFNSNAFDGLPMIASAIITDPNNSEQVLVNVGFAATPNVWIVTHIWVAHVS